ncbi:MAG: hypothetical protein ACRD4C_08990 [Candidatus Acidiferrales bacterium]
MILVCELDEVLALGELIEQHLTDSRHGKNTQFPFADLPRQFVYSRMAGYEDLQDPTMHVPCGIQPTECLLRKIRSHPINQHPPKQ